MQTRQSATTYAPWMFGVFASLALTSPSSAVDILDDPIQIDERITQLMQTSNSLCWEMYRYHQKQPDYADSYQAAKDLSAQASRVHDELRVGPVETDLLTQQVAEMKNTFTKVEAALTKWDTGDRSSIGANSGPTQRTVVNPGVDIEVPFVGLRVGGGSQVVVTDDGPPQLERRRLHPNSHGSKRSLERELVGVKLALSYLMEDAGMNAESDSPSVVVPAKGTSVPQPPKPDNTLNDSAKGNSPTAKKADGK